MPKEKQEWLDPEQSHILTEQECQLLSLFRTLNEAKRQAIFNGLFMAAIYDKKTLEHVMKCQNQDTEE